MHPIFDIGADALLLLAVLALPTFFFWHRWLRKRKLSTRVTILASIMATSVTAPILYVGLFALWFVSVSYYPHRTFNQNEWQTNLETRYEFSQNLIESKMLIGKTKDEVRQILGNENNSDADDHWSYSLGFKPDFIAIDPDVLDITFKDGKVVQVVQRET